MKKVKQEDRMLENLGICDELKNLARQNPQLRFGQLLLISGILGATQFVNGKTAYEMDFYEESLDLLNRINNHRKSK